MEDNGLGIQTRGFQAGVWKQLMSSAARLMGTPAVSSQLHSLLRCKYLNPASLVPTGQSKKSEVVNKPGLLTIVHICCYCVTGSVHQVHRCWIVKVLSQIMEKICLSYWTYFAKHSDFQLCPFSCKRQDLIHFYG